MSNAQIGITFRTCPLPYVLAGMFWLNLLGAMFRPTWMLAASDLLLVAVIALFFEHNHEKVAPGIWMWTA